MNLVYHTLFVYMSGVYLLGMSGVSGFVYINVCVCVCIHGSVCVCVCVGARAYVYVPVALPVFVHVDVFSTRLCACVSFCL